MTVHLSTLDSLARKIKNIKEKKGKRRKKGPSEPHHRLLIDIAALMELTHLAASNATKKGNT